MKKIYLLLIALLLPINAMAIDWDQWFMNSMVVADWLQTRDIADRPEYYETNDHLGMYPTTGEVNQHFIGWLLLYNAAYEVMPYRSGKYAIAISVGVYHGKYVADNHRIGINFRF